MTTTDTSVSSELPAGADQPSVADTPPPTVWPTLQAHDARALIRFYVDVLGFLETAVYGDGDQVAHAQLDWPEGGGIMLGSYKPESTWSRQPGTAGGYIVSDHVEEVYERARSAGATINDELSEPPYGGKAFSVEDPEGNLWSIGSYRGEPRT